MSKWMTFRSTLTPDYKFKKGRNFYQFKLFTTNYILCLVTNLFRGSENDDSFLLKKKEKESNICVIHLLTIIMLITSYITFISQNYKQNYSKDFKGNPRC